MSRKNKEMGRNQSPQRAFKFKLGKPRSFYKCEEQVQREKRDKTQGGSKREGRDVGKPYAVARDFSGFSASAFIGCLLGRPEE